MESFLRLIACLLTPDFSAISAMLIPITINMEPDMAASHIPFQLVPKLQ